MSKHDLRTRAAALAAAALSLVLPSCGWDLGPTACARRFNGLATLRNTTTGALVSLRSDAAAFQGPRGNPYLITCEMTGPSDLAMRNWKRHLRFAAENPAAPAGVRALLAGGPWCLASAELQQIQERGLPAAWCVESTVAAPIDECPPLPPPVPCNVGIPAPPGTPQLELSTLGLDFGGVAVGAVTGEAMLTVSNTGGGQLCLNAPMVVNDTRGDFVLNGSGCAPGPGDPAGTTVLSSATRASCTVGVRFAPNGPGTRAAGLRVSSSDAARPHVEVALAGTGQGGMLTALPDPVCFNVPPVVVPGVGSCYDRTLALTNLGPGRVTINSVALPAAALADWSLVGFAPLPPPVRRNSGQTLSVTLRTCRADAAATTVTVGSDASNGPFGVPLLPQSSGCTP